MTRITGSDGKDVPLPPVPPPHRAMDEAEAFVTTSMLTSVIDHGTGARARALGRPLAGKTGTSNGPKDTWFAGYSTDVAAVTWIGYDDGRVLGGAEQGAVTALPAWVSFMKAAHEARERKPRVDFSRPAGVTTVTIDQRTGKLPYPDDPDGQARRAVFLGRYRCRPPWPNRLLRDSGRARRTGARPRCPGEQVRPARARHGDQSERSGTHVRGFVRGLRRGGCADLGPIFSGSAWSRVLPPAHQRGGPPCYG